MCRVGWQRKCKGREGHERVSISRQNFQVLQGRRSVLDRGIGRQELK